MGGENKRGFQGVWIPKEVWLSDELSVIEKCLFAEIQSLDNEPDHCYAGNEHFMKFMGCSESTVVRGIKHLEELGFLSVKRRVTQHGTDRTMKVARLSKRKPRGSQNDSLLVLHEESNTEELPYDTDETPSAPPPAVKTGKSAKKPAFSEEAKAIEAFYFDTYKKLSDQSKLAADAPVYDYGRNRKMLSTRVRELGADKVKAAIIRAADDPWILEGGFVLATILSATMMTKLLNGKRKGEQEEVVETEQPEWKKNL